MHTQLALARGSCQKGSYGFYEGTSHGSVWWFWLFRGLAAGRSYGGRDRCSVSTDVGVGDGRHIVDEQEINGEIKYLVKWVGYDNKDDNTWELHEHVANTEALLKWEVS